MADIKITDLDFEEIRQSLKDYLQSQETFKGYNFEGSVMATIIRTLAHNTYLNAYYTNMAANEAFLDTAQIRQNIVSSAKQLGYTTRSRKSSVAQIELQFLPNDLPSQIVVPRFTKFNANLDGTNYYFITNQDYIIPNTGGFYRKVVDIFEGTSYTYTFNYDVNKQFYKILDDKIDTDTLEVYVKTNASSTERVEFTKVEDITEINSESNVYFLQEAYDGKYEIYFGDGILGKALTNGNVIEITGIICSGSEPNGIRVFTGNGLAGYNIDNISSTYVPTFTVISPAADGQDQESIKNIRFSAPKQYAAQKRLVTVSDYEAYLISKYSDIQSISVWGGEDNDPPLYGRILLSVKVQGSYVLSNFKKNQIIEEFGKRNMLTVQPIIVDPLFTFIRPTSSVYYDSTKTTLNSEGILNKISNRVVGYENDSISKFESSFYLSKYSTMIDSADESIINNSTNILVEKRFVPLYNSTFNYQINLNTSIKNSYLGYQGAVNSTGFKMANLSQDYFHYFDDDGKGLLRIYRLDSEDRKYVNLNAGTIDYENGIVKIINANFTEIENNYDEIRLFFEPYTSTYTPKKNEILLLSSPSISVIDVTKQVVTSSSVVDVQGNVTPITTNSMVDSVYV